MNTTFSTIPPLPTMEPSSSAPDAAPTSLPTNAPSLQQQLLLATTDTSSISSSRSSFQHSSIAATQNLPQREEMLIVQKDIPFSLTKQLTVICPYHYKLFKQYPKHFDFDPQFHIWVQQSQDEDVSMSTIKGLTPENPILIDEWDVSGCGCGYTIHLSTSDVRTIVGSMTLLGQRDVLLPKVKPIQSNGGIHVNTNGTNINNINTSQLPVNIASNDAKTQIITSAQIASQIAQSMLTNNEASKKNPHLRQFSQQPQHRVGFIGLLPTWCTPSFPMLLKLRLLRCYTTLVQRNISQLYNHFNSKVLYPLFHYYISKPHIIDSSSILSFDRRKVFSADEDYTAEERHELQLRHQEKYDKQGKPKWSSFEKTKQIVQLFHQAFHPEMADQLDVFNKNTDDIIPNDKNAGQYTKNGVFIPFRQIPPFLRGLTRAVEPRIDPILIEEFEEKQLLKHKANPISPNSSTIDDIDELIVPVVNDKTITKNDFTNTTTITTPLSKTIINHSKPIQQHHDAGKIIPNKIQSIRDISIAIQHSTYLNHTLHSVIEHWYLLWLQFHNILDIHMIHPSSLQPTSQTTLNSTPSVHQAASNNNDEAVPGVTTLSQQQSSASAYVPYVSIEDQYHFTDNWCFVNKNNVSFDITPDKVRCIPFYLNPWEENDGDSASTENPTIMKTNSNIDKPKYLFVANSIFNIPPPILDPKKHPVSVNFIDSTTSGIYSYRCENNGPVKSFNPRFTDYGGMLLEYCDIDTAVKSYSVLHDIITKKVTTTVDKEAQWRCTNIHHLDKDSLSIPTPTTPNHSTNDSKDPNQDLYDDENNKMIINIDPADTIHENLRFNYGYSEIALTPWVAFSIVNTLVATTISSILHLRKTTMNPNFNAIKPTQPVSALTNHPSLSSTNNHEVVINLYTDGTINKEAITTQEKHQPSLSLTRSRSHDSATGLASLGNASASIMANVPTSQDNSTSTQIPLVPQPGGSNASHSSSRPHFGNSHEEQSQDPSIWIHSYQLMLLPAKLRQIAQFSRTYSLIKDLGTISKQQRAAQEASAKKYPKGSSNNLSNCISPTSSIASSPLSDSDCDIEACGGYNTMNSSIITPKTPDGTDFSSFPDDIFNSTFHLQSLYPHYSLENCANLRILFSLHTPFPPSDFFSTLPWRIHLLHSCLCSDVLTFQSYDFARHFLTCCQRLLNSSATLYNFDQINKSIDIIRNLLTYNQQQIASSSPIQGDLNSLNPLIKHFLTSPESLKSFDSVDKWKKSLKMSDNLDITNELVYYCTLNYQPLYSAKVLGLGAGTIGVSYNNRITSVYNAHVGVRTEPNNKQQQSVSSLLLSHRKQTTTKPSVLLNKKTLADSYITRTFLLSQHNICESTLLCSLHDSFYFNRRLHLKLLYSNCQARLSHFAQTQLKHSHLPYHGILLDFKDNELRNNINRQLYTIYGQMETDSPHYHFYLEYSKNNLEYNPSLFATSPSSPNSEAAFINPVTDNLSTQDKIEALTITSDMTNSTAKSFSFDPLLHWCAMAKSIYFTDRVRELLLGENLPFNFNLHTPADSLPPNVTHTAASQIENAEMLSFHQKSEQLIKELRAKPFLSTYDQFLLEQVYQQRSKLLHTTHHGPHATSTTDILETQSLPDTTTVPPASMSLPDPHQIPENLPLALPQLASKEPHTVLSLPVLTTASSHHSLPISPPLPIDTNATNHTNHTHFIHPILSIAAEPLSTTPLQTTTAPAISSTANSSPSIAPHCRQSPIITALHESTLLSAQNPLILDPHHNLSLIQKQLSTYNHPTTSGTGATGVSFNEDVNIIPPTSLPDISQPSTQIEDSLIDAYLNEHYPHTYELIAPFSPQNSSQTSTLLMRSTSVMGLDHNINDKPTADVLVSNTNLQLQTPRSASNDLKSVEQDRFGNYISPPQDQLQQQHRQSTINMYHAPNDHQSRIFSQPGAKQSPTLNPSSQIPPTSQQQPQIQQKIPTPQSKKLIVCMSGVTPVHAPHLQLKAYSLMLQQQPELAATTTMALLLYTGLNSYLTEGGYSPLIATNKTRSNAAQMHHFDNYSDVQQTQHVLEQRCQDLVNQPLLPNSLSQETFQPLQLGSILGNSNPISTVLPYNKIENEVPIPHPITSSIACQHTTPSPLHATLTEKDQRDISLTSLYKYDGYHNTVLDVEQSLYHGRSHHHHHKNETRPCCPSPHIDLNLDDPLSNSSRCTHLQHQQRLFLQQGLQLHLGATQQQPFLLNQQFIRKYKTPTPAVTTDVDFTAVTPQNIFGSNLGKTGSSVSLAQPGHYYGSHYHHYTGGQHSHHHGSTASMANYQHPSNIGGANTPLPIQCDNKRCICQQELIKLSPAYRYHTNQYKSLDDIANDCTCVRLGPYIHSLLAQVQCIRYNYGSETVKVILGVMSGTNAFYYAHSQCEPHQFTDHFIHPLCREHRVFKQPWCYRSSISLYRAADVLMCNTFWDGLALTPLVATTLTHQHPNTKVLQDDQTVDGYEAAPDVPTLQESRRCVCEGCQQYKYGLSQPVTINKKVSYFTTGNTSDSSSQQNATAIANSPSLSPILTENSTQKRSKTQLQPSIDSIAHIIDQALYDDTSTFDYVNHPTIHQPSPPFQSSLQSQDIEPLPIPPPTATTFVTTEAVVLHPSSYFRPPPHIIVSEFQGSSRSMTGVIRTNPLIATEVAQLLTKCLIGSISSALQRYKFHCTRYNQAYRHPFLVWAAKCLSLLDESYKHNADPELSRKFQQQQQQQQQKPLQQRKHPQTVTKSLPSQQKQTQHACNSVIRDPTILSQFSLPSPSLFPPQLTPQHTNSSQTALDEVPVTDSNTILNSPENIQQPSVQLNTFLPLPQFVSQDDLVSYTPTSIPPPASMALTPLPQPQSLALQQPGGQPRKLSLAGIQQLQQPPPMRGAPVSLAGNPLKSNPIPSHQQPHQHQ